MSETILKVKDLRKVYDGKPAVDGIRMIVTEGKHLVDLGPQLGLLAIWLVIIYAIAFRVFRWE